MAYTTNSWIFPSDLLAAENQGAMMVIESFKSESKVYIPSELSVSELSKLAESLGSRGSGSTAPTKITNATDRFCLFIPGGGQNQLRWEQKHEYSDVKLARALLSAIVPGGGGDLGGVIPSLLGFPINPRVEVLFRNTDLRRYQFSFLFAPTSKKESEDMKKIIERIKWGAAPRISNNTLTFESPNEFQFSFYYKTEQGNWKENTNIPKMERGVITNIQVDLPMPGAEFSTFSNGHPVSSMLTLEFVEMAIIDKRKIEQGY